MSSPNPADIVAAPQVLKRSPPNGLSVLISGAGVGGLMTALECWRVGCDVRIFERSQGIVTTGDSFTIGASAIDAFKNWPELRHKNEAIAYHLMVSCCKHNGKQLMPPMEFSALTSDPANAPRIYRHSRPWFHAILHDQLGKVGLSVEYGMEAVDFFEDEQAGCGGVVLQNGPRHEADLVVAADGVRTTS